MEAAPKILKSMGLEKEWQRTPVFLPGESHGQRNLAGCSSWICKNWTPFNTISFFLSMQFIYKKMMFVPGAVIFIHKDKLSRIKLLD